MELTGEQRALRDAVRAMLARHQRRAPGAADGPRYDPALWQRLCGEIGVAGLAVPEEYGGAAAGPVETHVVAEELGTRLTPSPLLGSAVLATQALLASGDSAACQRLLPPVAAGTAVAALAWTPAAGHWDPGEVACQAVPPASPGGGWALAGTAHHVLYGDCADVLLVAARAPDGIGLFDVDPHQAGVTRSAVTAMDLTSRLAVVQLDGAAGRRVGGRGAGGQGGRAALTRARDLACIALSAEQAGAARRALELTVGYAKVRVQFGRPIGGFQVIAHRLADLHVLVESARSVSYAAAAAAAGPAGPGLLAAAAKVYCSEAFTRVAAEMIQLHGAPGITWEHDAHHFLKRAHATAQLFGPPAGHVARIAAAVIGG
jgi:alkylation response protein AidB-like acyl-CoA dehydrogenase